jgi:hypothetical protein
MKDFLTLASHPNTIYRLLSYFLPVEAYYRNADLFFVTEQIPDPQSRVSHIRECQPGNDDLRPCDPFGGSLAGNIKPCFME